MAIDPTHNPYPQKQYSLEGSAAPENRPFRPPNGNRISLPGFIFQGLLLSNFGGVDVDLKQKNLLFTGCVYINHSLYLLDKSNPFPFKSDFRKGAKFLTRGFLDQLQVFPPWAKPFVKVECCASNADPTETPPALQEIGGDYHYPFPRSYTTR